MPVPYWHSQLKEGENERWNKEKLREHAEGSAFSSSEPIIFPAMSMNIPDVNVYKTKQSQKKKKKKIIDFPHTLSQGKTPHEHSSME